MTDNIAPEKQYVHFVNRSTGASEYIESTFSDKNEYKRFRRAKLAARRFANYVRFNCPDYVFKHVSLTQTVESYSPKMMNAFRTSMKKKFPGIVDIWTSEVQEERLKKYGDVVLHWHLVVAVDDSYDFDIEWINKAWGHGFCWIRGKKNFGILKYIMKYITKDGKYLTGFDYKKFGGSRLPSLYSLTIKQIEQAMHHYDFGVLESLQWIKGKGYELLYDVDSWRLEKLKMIDVSWRKDWEYRGIVSEPF